MSKVPDFAGLFTNGTDSSTAIPDVPSETACGYLCLKDDTCKAFFYDNSTLLCKPEQECRLVSMPTHLLWPVANLGFYPTGAWTLSTGRGLKIIEV